MRLFLSLQTPHFSDDESYYILRQVENIGSTGKLFFYDELSYGGRTTIILPGYYAILTFFNFFTPEYYIKIYLTEHVNLRHLNPFKGRAVLF